MIQSSEAEIDRANVPAATDTHTYHQVSLETHMLSYRIKEINYNLSSAILYFAREPTGRLVTLIILFKIKITLSM